MKLNSSFFLLIFVFLGKLCLAQNTPKLQTSLPVISPTNSLSQTLLGVADKSKVNIVADTTTQDPNPEANRPTIIFKNKNVGQFISEQGPVFGYYWNQMDADTVLVWPKPDIAALTRKIAKGWQQESWESDKLPAEIKDYFSDVARKVDQEGGEEKRKSIIGYRQRLIELPERQQEILAPLVRRAQRQYSVDRSLVWLSDNFWSNATVSISRFNHKDAWYISGSTDKEHRSGRGLSSPITLTFVPFGEKLEADEAVNANLGSRWVSDVPLVLAKPIQFKVENISVAGALEQLSKICGISLQLDNQAGPLVQGKHLTIAVDDMVTSALLRDIALLFDLKWTAYGDKVVASPNENDFQNTAAKIGSVPCLVSWDNRTLSTHPQWDDLFLQETTLEQAKKGLPLSGFSEELQRVLRDYCEEREANDILRTWLKTAGAFPSHINVSWQLLYSDLQRNNTPLPTSTLSAEELGNAQFMAEYSAKYFVLVRPFTVTIGTQESTARYTDLSIPLDQKTKQGEGNKAP